MVRSLPTHKAYGYYEVIHYARRMKNNKLSKVIEHIMGTTFVLLLLQCASTASGFIPSPMQQLLSTPPTNDNGLYAHKENKKPMIVVGSTDEALASAMALCTRDVLLKTTTKHKRRSKIPRAQNIAFFNKRSTHHDKPQERLSSETISSLQNALLFLGPSLDTYDQILANSYNYYHEYHKMMMA